MYICSVARIKSVDLHGDGQFSQYSRWDGGTELIPFCIWDSRRLLLSGCLEIVPRGWGGWSVTLITNFHLLPISRMCGDLPSHPIMIWCLGTGVTLP